jgi:dTDP-4-amino-4,6-dideoxygalactose transaminase
MKVKYLDFGQIWLDYPEAQTEMFKALNRGDMVLREQLKEFEEKFAKFVGTKYAVGVNSGTDALFLTLKALGIGPGDEVITVSNTFVATIQVIDNIGATPILVDVDEDGLMDMKLTQEAITKKTKAIIPVHLAGDVAEIDLTISPNIHIIEDACQALGANSPDLGCYSFYPAKLLGSPGDGGAVVTNDKKIYEELLKLRNHYLIGKASMGEGKSFDENETYKFGYNSRLDNGYAAFLSKKLDRLKDDTYIRKHIARTYDEAFSTLPMRLPRMRQVYQDYIIRTPRRDELHEFLKDAGIETLGADQMSPHRFPGLGLDHYHLPITDEIFEQSLRLPCNQFLVEKEVEYVIEKVKEFFDG